MDEVPPVVFQPVDGEGEYALVVDAVFDAVVLRDVLRRAAADALKRSDRATNSTVRNKNHERYEVLWKYAERCERIRELEAERITQVLGLRREASQR